MAYIKDHWQMILAIGLPILMSLVATLVSVYQDPDHNPETPPPGWVQMLQWLQRWMTVLAPKGTKGMFGTRMSLPYLHVPSKGDSVSVATFLPFILILSVGLSACACWGARANEPACVALRDIIHCATNATVNVAADLAAQAAKANSALSWDSVQVSLQNAGAQSGGCVLAQLEANLMDKPMASPTHSAAVYEVREQMAKFKEHFKITSTKFCATSKSGKVTCQ